MRADAEVLIYVDIQKSLEDGALQWWLSENGVVLTEGDENELVPTRYWKLVKGRRQDVGILWEDGVEVAELPQSVRGRKAPSGKSSKGKEGGGEAEGEGECQEGWSKGDEGVERGRGRGRVWK
jgi:2'-phosphotransferase